MPNASRTVVGVFDAALPSGMVLRGCRLMCGPAGQRWIAMPSYRQHDRDGKPRVDDRGKQIWVITVDFVDRATRDRCTEQILAALRREHPEHFVGGPVP
jgi:hypothetical protein